MPQGSYLIYLRKSRADLEAEQRGEGETLSRHQRALLDLARRLDLPVSGIYREIVSGETISARPVMQKLLAEVEAGQWDGVLVMEVERLARGDTIDQGVVARAFRSSGTRIVTPAKTYDPGNEYDEEYFEFGLFMSRREYKTINRRLQRGREASVREGKYVGSGAPYGYRRQKLERDKGFSLTADLEEAEVVRLIFALYTAGERRADGSVERLGPAAIAKRLDALHVPPRRGREWSPATVRDMLSNPVYTGKLRWNWRRTVPRREDGRTAASRPRSADCLLTDGLHAPIVPQAVFDAAQARLARKNAAPAAGTAAAKNPLAGLVVCGRCGRRMQRRPYGNGRPPALICPAPGCGNVGAELALVEARVLEALEGWLGGYRLDWDSAAPSAAGEQRRALARMDRELAALEVQRERLHDLLERGVYGEDTFWERRRSLAARARQLQADRDALAEALDGERGCQALPSPPPDLPELYRQLPSPGAKNRLLREVLEKAVYTKDASGRWGHPDAFTLRLYPRLPRLTDSGAVQKN